MPYFCLDADGAISPCRHIALDTVDSTHCELTRRLQQGETGPLWISARHQSAGQGRQGRVWRSYSGNLYTSLLFHYEGVSGRIGALAQIAGLAVFDAIAEKIDADSRSRLGLKWPNDVLYDGCKIAGILINVLWDGNAPAPAVLIGFGINLVDHPAADILARPDRALPQAATDLRMIHGRVITPEIMLRALSWHWQRFYHRWCEETDDRGSSYDLWRRRCVGIGKPVTIVTTPERPTISGILVDLLPCGAALVQFDDGQRRRIYAGDFITGEDRAR